MAKPQNIILIVADSLRYDSINNGLESGLPYTEKHSAKFTEARSAGCWTLPATASLFTGLLPHQHGATSQSRKLNNEATTLAEKLKADGYKTYQVTANVATTEIFGLDKGFDEVHKIWSLVQPKFKKVLRLAVLAGKPRVRKMLLSKDKIVKELSEDL
ncbi:MAG: sulfatase-like hydrolase/transferase, partial [Crocinitomicaceae bacterium]|nr:sulfatase-like hydrolase/transferase [Crocinitomicaceae bacterium]